jgi:hypothetical protein
MRYFGYNDVDLFLKTKKTSRPGNEWKMDSHLQEIFIFLSLSLRARCQSFAKSACDENILKGIKHTEFDAGLESVEKSCKKFTHKKLKRP